MFASSHERAQAARSLAFFGALTTLYVLVGHLGLELAFYQGRSTIVWAPSGVAVAAVWLFGYRTLWATFAGALLTNLLAAPELALSTLIALGNVAEAAAAGWLIRRFTLAHGLATMRDVLVFVGAIVVAAPLISSLNGVLWLLVLGGMPLADAPLAGLIWWLGDAGGVLVVTSVVIAFVRPPAAAQPFRPDLGVVALAAVAALAAAIGPGVSGTGHELAAWASVLCLVLPYPAATWAAMRLGIRGAAACSAIIALACVLGTAAGAGPFQSGDVRIDIVSLWPLLATLTISALLLGAASGERGLLQDRRLALEGELQRARSLAELGLLSGGIAHDFNNLLTVIQANAAMAADGDARLREACVHDIQEAAQRGQELTEQLLAYAGRRKLPPRRLDLSALAAETARLLMPHCPPGAELRRHLGHDCWVDGDPVQLRQVLMNVLINAFDAMKSRHGEVTLEVRAHDGRVELAVSDDGPGIAPAQRARIFEPFFSTKDEGRGMGLSAVHGIVQIHGGAIAIHARAGGGTRLSITLPAAELAVSAGGRVLVVDDEPGMRRLAVLILERAGFEVASAERGSDALAAAQLTPPDVALLDVRIGAESGIELMRRLRIAHPRLPVVLMSGFHEEVIDPAIPILEKPFQPEALVSAISAAVRAA